MSNNIEESVNTRNCQENDLTYEEEQVQRRHAAGQLIMQHVQHHGTKGITAFQLAVETRIGRDLVDEMMRELVMHRQVMIRRDWDSMSTLFLPYQAPESRMGRPRASATTVTPSHTPIVIKESPGRYSVICPECNRTLHCVVRCNLTTNIQAHLVNRHGYTEERARQRLIEDGAINGHRSAAIRAAVHEKGVA